MPIVIGGLTVLSMGKIVSDRKKFHSKRYIWPVGFKSVRTYASLKGTTFTRKRSSSLSALIDRLSDFNRKCEYVNEIIDGGTEPKFVVTCMDDPEHPLV